MPRTLGNQSPIAASTSTELDNDDKLLRINEVPRLRVDRGYRLE